MKTGFIALATGSIRPKKITGLNVPPKVERLLEAAPAPLGSAASVSYYLFLTRELAKKLRILRKLTNLLKFMT